MTYSHFPWRVFHNGFYDMYEVRDSANNFVVPGFGFLYDKDLATAGAVAVLPELLKLAKDAQDLIPLIGWTATSEQVDDFLKRIDDLLHKADHPEVEESER